MEGLLYQLEGVSVSSILVGMMYWHQSLQRNVHCQYVRVFTEGLWQDDTPVKDIHFHWGVRLWCLPKTAAMHRWWCRSITSATAATQCALSICLVCSVSKPCLPPARTCLPQIALVKRFDTCNAADLLHALRLRTPKSLCPFLKQHLLECRCHGR